MDISLLAFVESVVVPGLVGGGIALAVLKFLGQRIVDHRLGKEVERYKTELGEKTEALKTQLSIYLHEQTVAISRADAQSAKAISNVYTGIREVMNPLSLILAGSPIIDGSDRQSVVFYIESAERAHDAILRMMNTVADHAIYFDAPTYGKVRQFLKVAGIPIASYLKSLRKASTEGETDDAVLRLAENGRQAIRKAYDAEIGPLQNELVDTFRQGLGISRLV